MKICTKCKIEKSYEEYYHDKYSPDGHTRQCKECRNKQYREYYQLHPERKREVTRRWQEANRERISERNRQYHREHAEHINTRKRQYLHQLKEEVISAYGGHCYMWGKDNISCGGDRLEMLTIDHINQDAAYRRRNDPNHPSRGDIRSWLRSQGYPSRFRVACMNHNRLAWIEHTMKEVRSNKASAQSERKRRKELKQQIVEMLGGHCIICGETDIRILTLHHINNNGRKHRAQYNFKPMPMYRKLVKIPVDQWEYKIECRCYNCNVTELWTGVEEREG